MYKNEPLKTPLKFSQNFLTSKRIINHLLSLTSIISTDHVIEIGAGKGHITSQLLLTGANVTAVELDEQFYQKLKSTFMETSQLKLYHGDFLNMALPPHQSYKVFSNIPFSQTTAIMKKLLDGSNPPEETWLIMEKGAARRFMNSTGNNVLSLSWKPFYNFRILYYFRRQDFHPMPSVDIALLYICRKAPPDLPFSERAAFRRFLTKANQNGLSGIMTKTQITAALKQSGMTEPKYTYLHWCCLYQAWKLYYPK